SRKVADDVTLRDAVIRKDFHLCVKLLEEGADVNATDEDDSTLLHLLARKYSKVETRAQKIPALLLQHGANINAKDKNGDTPLHIVAREGLEDFCRVILADMESRNCRSKVDTKNKKLMTPLHLASQQGQDRIVQLLLDAGADPLSSDGQKYLPIHHAADKGYAPCCKLLFPSYPGDAKMESRVMTPLMLAARGGFYRCLEVMAGEKIELNKQDRQGNTALHIAAKLGFDKFVKLLLDLNCDLNIKNKVGNTPLMEAVTKGRASCLLLLLSKGAKADEINKAKRSALHISADKRAGECMEYLLQQDMKRVIDLQDNDGCTALHIAIKRDHEKCALLLLNAGALPEVACKQKITPLHLATQNTKTNVLEGLLRVKGLDLDPENINKETPFHLAAKCGLRDTCLLLLRKGARLNASNKSGQTALHLSAYHGHPSVVKLLIKRGIDKRAKDDKGSVALHAAACKGNLECCKVLVEADKISGKEKNKRDRYPFDYAFINGHQSVYQFLLQNLPFKSYATLPQGIQDKLHSHTHKALKERNKSAVEAIVDSMWWEAGFGSAKRHEEQPCSNFRELIKLYPLIAEKVMNKCTTTCPTTKMKSYDFRIFEDNYCIRRGKKKTGLDIPESPFYQDTWKVMPFADEMITDNLLWKKEHPVNVMVVHRCPQLLQHPLTNAWLNHKWKAYARFIYFMTLFLQLFFLASLVVFMAVVRNWKHVTKPLNITEEEFCRAFQSQDDMTSDVNETSLLPEANGTIPQPPDSGGNKSFSFDPSWSHVCHAVLCFLLILQIVLEVNYIYKLRCQYLNVTSLVSVSCIVLCVLLLMPTSVCGLQLGIKSVFIWQCGIIALLLASIRLMTTINRLPTFSVFTSITYNFIKTYLKGVMYVLLMIFLFAFFFHLLLSDHEPFNKLHQSLIKMIVWILGDIGYDDTFLVKELEYPYLVNFLFLVFLFTIGVLLVTLLKAPSTDINKIKFYRMARRAQMYFTIDICFPSFKRSHAVGKFCDREHKFWIVSKLEQILNRKQSEGVVVPNLLSVVKIGLIDAPDYRKPRERHWLVVQIEDILNSFMSETEEEDAQNFPDFAQERIANQTNKLDQLLVLYNQLYESYQKQNEQMNELRNQIDNLKLHTF
ncbi:transient receptor potential cation channel subfamily A member 1-like, partial [Penaeus japonicus]|uniref:transient receptor potential cation channel subfamily A member 1-like n=1 Tax=Penaeus japonicus TaxID=27405 RepID=UPI001C7170B0